MAVVEVVDEVGDDDPHAAKPNAPTTIAVTQTAPCFPIFLTPSVSDPPCEERGTGTM
jgi:hypothetical protein